MAASLKDEVLRLAWENYGTKPEYLWEKYPEYGVLRHADNQKWYAIIMEVSRDKLGLPGDELIAIMNVKLDCDMIAALRMSEGFCPAYHMNKTHWITVRLDGSVDIERVADLLDESFEMTRKKRT